MQMTGLKLKHVKQESDNLFDLVKNIEFETNQKLREEAADESRFKFFMEKIGLPYDPRRYNTMTKIEIDVSTDNRIFINHNDDKAVVGKATERKKVLERCNLSKVQVNALDKALKKLRQRGSNRPCGVIGYRFATFYNNFTNPRRPSDVIEKKIALFVECTFGDVVYVFYNNEQGRLRVDLTLHQERVQNQSV
ncbi:hypothetical protein D8X77_17925 [Vibrio vulnificus]|nr:hypothetical protein [Vibrio vulnificus]